MQNSAAAGTPGPRCIGDRVRVACGRAVAPRRGCRPSQRAAIAKALGVILGEVGEIDSSAACIGELALVCRRRGMTWPVRSETAWRERLGERGLGLAIVGDDIQKCLEASLDSGVGGMGVYLQDEIGLGAQLGCEASRA